MSRIYCCLLYTSIGKAKSKKTFNVSAIVAAALKNGTVLRYVAELQEDKRKVLYVDTEQSPYHCLKVMTRILRMAGLGFHVLVILSVIFIEKYLVC